MKKIGDREFTTFDDVWNDNTLLTDDDRSRIDFEVELIGKLIEAREATGVTQKELADRCGLAQSAIARVEKMRTMPQVDTLIKILRPLGYKLTIVPDDQTTST